VRHFRGETADLGNLLGIGNPVRLWREVFAPQVMHGEGLSGISENQGRVLPV